MKLTERLNKTLNLTEGIKQQDTEDHTDSVNEHTHEFTIDADGNGSTTFTYGEGKKHVHEIKKFKVQNTNNHTHNIKVQESSQDKPTKAEIKRYKQLRQELAELSKTKKEVKDFTVEGKDIKLNFKDGTSELRKAPEAVINQQANLSFIKKNYKNWQVVNVKKDE
jgi:hypothetical protein